MKKISAEMAVGLFMILGILALGYLSVKLGKMEIIGSRGYEVFGVFSNAGGIRAGSVVSIAGVDVGRVKSVTLDSYEARITMVMNDSVRLPVDSIALIKTRGLIGERYIEFTPGADEENIKPGGRVRDTQPPVDLEALIAKYMFGGV